LKSRTDQRKRIKHRRIISLVLLVLLVGSSPFWSEWIADQFAASTLRTWTDCRLTSVQYSGMKQLTRDSLESTARIPYGASMFDIDLAEIRHRLQKLPWVDQAILQRRLPNRVDITIVEHVPVATIRSDRIYALSEGGDVLPVPDEDWVWNLPMITSPKTLKLYPGDEIKDAQVLALLSQVVAVNQAAPALWANLSEVYYHGNEIRATLLAPPAILKMGKTSEHRTWVALQELLKKEYYGSEETPNISVIDLRIPGNIIVDSPKTMHKSQESSGT
jgi:cell division septal protein FtsQ